MRVVIFANGEMDDPATTVARWVRTGDLVIAADGGAGHAIAAGLVPDHIIGDMDSLSESRQADLADRGVSFHRSPVEKDETDLELALIWAAERTEVREIIVLGAFGGRPDQALANLLLLALPALRGRQVLMVDGDWAVRLLNGGERLVLDGQRGERLSLIPLGGDAVGVRTAGLQFPLNDETLYFGPARGVSNCFAADRVTVTLREGRLWCFHEETSA